MIFHNIKKLLEMSMTIEAKIDALTAAIAAIAAPTAVDLTPVLKAIEGVATQLTAIAAVIGTETPAVTPTAAPVA